MTVRGVAALNRSRTPAQLIPLFYSCPYLDKRLRRDIRQEEKGGYRSYEITGTNFYNTTNHLFND